MDVRSIWGISEQNIGMSSSPQDTETDFAVFVEVGVKPNSSISGGNQSDSGRADRIVWWATNEKVEKTSFIRRVKWSSYESMYL